MPSRNPNLVEAVVRELAVVMAEAMEVAEVATNTDRRVVTVTHHQAGKASVVTVAHRILQGNVLCMDRTVTPVVRLVTTVDTVAQSKDHQPLADCLLSVRWYTSPRCPPGGCVPCDLSHHAFDVTCMLSLFQQTEEQCICLYSGSHVTWQGMLGYTPPPCGQNS